MRKILVLRGGALGDFIVTLPALELLRRRWPAAKIELVGNATAAGLGQARGLIDTVHSQHEARWGALYGEAPLPRALAAWAAEFDLVVNYWPDPEGELKRRFPIRPDQIYLSADAAPTRAPAAAHYCAPLDALGPSTNHFWFRIGQLNSAAARPEPAPIAIHPGSGSPRKNWPAERWMELGAELKRRHAAEFVVVTGEAESNHPLTSLGEPARNLALEDLVTRLSRCRLFLGHDSGVSHLAAACGVPCVLLFGPTDPNMWAPPAPHVRVVQRGPDLDSISVAEVRAALPLL